MLFQLKEVEVEYDIIKMALDILVCHQAGSPRVMAKVPVIRRNYEALCVYDCKAQRENEH